MKAVLICDHSLDPRLRKRVAWLQECGYSVSVYTDSSRGKHFSNADITEMNLATLKFSDLQYFDLVYISGAKVLLQKLFLISRVSYSDIKLVYEIPDLPLRSHNSIQNAITLFVFSFFVKVLFKNVVVTSKAFISCLPLKKNYFLCENLPPKSLIAEVDRKLPVNEIVTIGFVGALRYQYQMFMLIKFCVDNGHRAIFYGGPKETENALIVMCQDANLDISNTVNFFGPYDQKDLKRIYENIDYVYSVYDSKQPNVKLALPNKLYEAQLFRTPIIVARHTYLSEYVDKLKIGYSVDSNEYLKFSDDMRAGIKRSYSIDPDKVIDKICTSQKSFYNWLKNI